jgi:hypothetical protein
MGMIAPPGYPKMVLTPSARNASNTATEPLIFVVGFFSVFALAGAFSIVLINFFL